MKPFDLDAAVIDLDGTLVDTLNDFVLALNLMLADLPTPYRDHRVSHETVATLVGKGSEHLITSVLGQVRVGLSEDLYSLAWSSYQRHYMVINGQHATIYPGVVAGLRQLREHGLKLACLTNKPTAFALPLLRTKGLAGFFEFTFGGDAFERKKPDPLPLLKTCQALKTTPARTLMIGDSSNDALAARAAGCPVLLVTYGYNHGEPIRTADADAFVDSLEQLFPQLLQPQLPMDRV